MESKRKQQKVNTVQDLSSKLSQTTAAIIFDYQGLSSEKLNQLRSKVRENGNKIQAVKKNLLRIAFEKANKPFTEKKEVTGQAAIVILNSNQIETIKTLDSFAKENEKPAFLSGIFDNQLINKEQFLKLANIAPREQLIAQTVGLIKNPINRFVLNLKGNQRKLVYVLKAVAENK